jgi:exodeoxyribonuclease V alpha subunit
VSRNSSYYEIEQLNALIDQIETELALEFQVDEFKYDQTQRDALIAFANADFYLLTGGPGTGKTTVLKGIVKLFQKLENARLEDIAVAAPTGRAAARINEIDASLKAKTIHKLLKATDNGMFDVTAANPLEEQLIIIDESSMIENKLFARLLEASPLAQKIVFIGDENQLPSVGYGEVFANLLAVKSIPKTQLEKVHRQKEGNGIINLAYKILNNEVHELEDLNLPNVTTRFNQGDDLDAIDEIFRNSLKLNPDVLQFQVITSFYKGTLGINAVNKSLQSTYQAEVLNHPLDDVTHAVMRKDSCFYEHDKVMHLVNDSALGLSNGDVGSIEQIVLKNQKLDYAQVRFNEEVKKLTSDNFKNLTLSYGCSVHKTQGSEYQQVVFAVEAGLHPFFLNKKLIYTAITRAKQNLYLVGD